MMTHTTVLTGTTLLTLLSMFSWRAQVLTAAQRDQNIYIYAFTSQLKLKVYFLIHACHGIYTHGHSISSTIFYCVQNMQLNLQCSCVSWTAHAFACDVVACSIILAQTFLLAVVAISGMVTEVLTSPATVPECTYACSSDGVTQRLVLTLTPATAMWAPVIKVTRCTKTQSGFSFP